VWVIVALVVAGCQPEPAEDLSTADLAGDLTQTDIATGGLGEALATAVGDFTGETVVVMAPPDTQDDPAPLDDVAEVVADALPDFSEDFPELEKVAEGHDPGPLPDFSAGISRMASRPRPSRAFLTILS